MGSILAKNPTKEDRHEAIEFADSWRGQYIISQALHIAISTLENIEKSLREESNIDDMKYLEHYVFPMYQNYLDTNREDVIRNNNNN